MGLFGKITKNPELEHLIPKSGNSVSSAQEASESMVDDTEEDLSKTAEQRAEHEQNKRLLRHSVSDFRSRGNTDSEPQPILTFSLVLCAFTCVIGSSFTFGYNTGVVNTPEDVMREWISHSHSQMTNTTMTVSRNTLIWSVTVSIFAIGGMVGGLVSGTCADHFGRRGGMMWNNLSAIVAGLLMAFSFWAQWYYMLIVGRFIIGINSGLNSSLAPMYLNEISPKEWRGKLGTAHQLGVTIGILTAQALGTRYILGTESWWPYLFGLICAPAVFQLVVFPFCIESPTYSVVFKADAASAEADLKRIRGRPHVLGEIHQLMIAKDRKSALKEVSFRDMFFERLLRWPLVIAVMMMFSQQLSGINVAIYYSSNIFKGAGLNELGSNLATLGMGLMNVLMTVVSLLLVDKFGRRPLHLSGLFGMFLSSIFLVLSLSLKKLKYDWAGYMSILWLCTFVIAFATGPGSIPWFYTSEIFADSSRGRANSIAVMSNWLANFIVGLLFLPLKDAIDQYSLLVFTLLLVLFIIFTYKFVPETKLRQLPQINEDLFDRQPGLCR